MEALLSIFIMMGMGTYI